MSDLVCTLFWLLGLSSHDGNFESPDHYNENKCYNTRALASSLLITPASDWLLVAAAQLWLVQTGWVRGPGATRRAECDHFVSVRQLRTSGACWKILVPALNIFMWERDPATWSSGWTERVRFAGQGKCFSVFQLKAVSGVWSDIGPVSESAIIIRCLGQTSRTWSSKPK